MLTEELWDDPHVAPENLDRLELLVFILFPATTAGSVSPGRRFLQMASAIVALSRHRCSADLVFPNGTPLQLYCYRR